ncbi:serine/threonine-protein kinase [Streptacidiphilus sp. MAP12-33]|uniref:serine/threonine-protein kinase n=1 Tax=Streptacidiphilus sp. MAP12-33 TaxID=3156266 RepID=UPI0035121834
MGRYLLGERLGRGGMGVVWRAHDQVLDREVAVKELNVVGVGEEDTGVLYARMQQEARAAARIDHPGVITIHDVVEHEGRPWIVMELVDGRSLAEIITMEGTLLPRDAARVGAQVASALVQAHRYGVLHRDVKPANVLIERRGRVVLTDFGIAQFAGGGGLTRTGEIVGSPDYLAPERLTGHRTGPESDLWALGATLYAAVEGQSPFLRATTIGTLQAVISDPLPQAAHAGPLAPILDVLLRKDPEQRATGDEALALLEEVAQGRTPRTPTVISPLVAPTPLTVPFPQSPPPGAPGAAGTGATVPFVPVYPTAPQAPPQAGRSGRGRRTWLFVAAAAVGAALVGGVAAAAVLTAGPHPGTRAGAVSTVGAGTSTTPAGGGGAPPSATLTPTPTPTPTAPASPTVTPTPTPTPTPPAATDPASVVTAYYSAINAHDYGTAWNLGGKNLGGSYGSFASGFSDTVNDTVTIDAVSGDTVDVHLHAVHTDGSTADYSGSYTVQYGEITQASLQRIA